MEYFDDTAMFIYGQMLLSISGDTLDTDKTFIMALTFLSTGMLSILKMKLARKGYLQLEHILLALSMHSRTDPGAKRHS